MTKKMSDETRKNKIELEVKLMGMVEAKPNLKNWNYMMMTLQVSFILKNIKSIISAGTEMIPSNIYALGENPVKMTLKKGGE